MQHESRARTQKKARGTGGTGTDGADGSCTTRTDHTQQHTTPISYEPFESDHNDDHTSERQKRTQRQPLHTHRRSQCLTRLTAPCARVPVCVVSVEKGETKLKHSAGPKESAALTQAKVLKAVEGKHELHHVETVKGEGLTEAQKEAFKNKVKDDEE